MIEQRVKILSIRHGHAVVEPVGKSTCSGCSSRCSDKAAFSSVRKARQTAFEVLNPLHAKPGEEVVIGMQGHTLVVYSAFAYLLPLLSLIVFAILGQELFTALTLNAEAGAVLAGVAGLFSGLRLSGWLALRVTPAEEALPVILRHHEVAIKPVHWPLMSEERTA
ncbi:MAG: SoxR reducing system RseC family protein [Thiothrix sp.]|nr:SoxR reducing system RseC family protein [Thiothrix sp.]HPE59297.1 SoxR reducing system RseC family protein [Thiolinea sp.]